MGNFLGENIPNRLGHLLTTSLEIDNARGLEMTDRPVHEQSRSITTLRSVNCLLDLLDLSANTIRMKTEHPMHFITLSHLQTHFDAIAADEFLKTLCQKVKLLIMSNFPFGLFKLSFMETFQVFVTMFSKSFPADLLYVGEEG